MDFFKQYPSGLRLVARKLENFYYTVSFGIYVDVGSVKESAANNGYSHFIEHLLFKGTERRTSQQISEEMDDIGANLNAYTAKDCTCFYTKSVASDLEKCMDLLSDMYFFAKFDEVELQREKSVVVEEINMCEDTPDEVSQDLISNALFFNQALGQTILGNAANIKNSDRHSIKKFKDKHYIPTNTVLTVAGNFEFDQLDKFVEKYFESNFSKQTTQDVAVSTVYTNKFLHKFKKIEQSHLEIAVGGCALSSPKRYALSILTGVLGGGMSSRLFQSVREKNGLAYSVYSYPSFYSDCGMLETYVGLSPDNIGEVCRLLKQEICLLLEKGITKAELNRAKAQAVNGLYMNIEESNMTLMRLYGRCMLKTGKLYNVETEVENYKSVTIEDVNNLARELFAQDFASSYVGKEVKNFDEISKLKF